MSCPTHSIPLLHTVGTDILIIGLEYRPTLEYAYILLSLLIPTNALYFFRLVCAVVNRMTIELRKEGPNGHGSMVSTLPMDIPLHFVKGKLTSGEVTVTDQSDQTDSAY